MKKHGWLNKNAIEYLKEIIIMSELNEKDLNEVNGGHTGPCTPAFELDTEPLKRLMNGEITMEEYQEIMKKNEQLAFGGQNNG